MNITKKEIIKNYNNIIRVGYCELQYLLRFKGADFYTYGVYGWNSDIYCINNNTAICTGYRPFGNILPKREITQKYEMKAKTILEREKNCEKARNKIDKLLQQFINEITK